MAPRRAPSAQGLASAPVPAQRTPPRVQPGARSSKPRAPSPPARWANQKKEKKAPYDEGRLIFLAGVVKDKGVGALSPTQLTELMELKEQAELQAVAGPRKKTGGAKAEGGARRRSVSDSSGLTGAAKRWLQEQRGVDSRADQDALAGHGDRRTRVDRKRAFCGDDDARDDDDMMIQGDAQITTPTPTFVKSLSHLSKLLAIYMKNSKK